jgi:hypothetical protein
MRNKKSALAATLEYWTRQAGRGIFLVLAIFILFLILMAVTYAVPRVWNWAIG